MQTPATVQKGIAYPPIEFKNAPHSGPISIPIPIPPSKIPMYSSFSVGKKEEMIESAHVELRPAPTPPII
jgi:hypothetical protein